jgi:hypothetical protein
VAFSRELRVVKIHRKAIIRLDVINHFNIFLIILLSLSSDTVNVQSAVRPDTDMDTVMCGPKMWFLIITERKVHVS